MHKPNRFAYIGVTALALASFAALPGVAHCQASSPVTVGAPPAPESAEAIEARESPEAMMFVYITESRWDRLEAMVDRLVKGDARSSDGMPRMYSLLFRFDDWAMRWTEDDDRAYAARFRDYAKAYPRSPLAAMLPALQMGASAWRVRGMGYSSTVTPEGRALYRERIERAWSMLMAARQNGSRLAAWYQWALKFGLDSGRPVEELLPLLSEGVRRHPGQFTIYYPVLRTFTPLWGGDYTGATAFIDAAVASPSNTNGERLYAYLAWKLDELGGEQQSFFEESGVDWPRMRRGFEAIMKATDGDPMTRVTFAYFACRAHDRDTYYRELKALPEPGYIYMTSPPGLTPEVCDARFKRKP